MLKLPVNKLNEEYQEYVVEKAIKENNGKIYAPLDAIAIAFNVQITEKENSLSIFTLEYLVTWYDTELKKAENGGYLGIADQSFENQKSVLYNRFIVKKEGGLYKVIDENGKEILSDKYAKIEFVEITKEFLVTDSLEQVGIIDLNGKIVVEPVYKSISVLDKNLKLYLIQKGEKYGVVKSGNKTIINPEYDNIGVTFESEKKLIILDTLIPVCKNEKWGAFDTEGNLAYKLEYDSLGCDLTTVDVNGTKKTVNPVITIKECDGVVVRKDTKYGVLNKNGSVVVPIQVDSIYSIENSQRELEYFMIYNNEELNIVKMLIEQGLIEDPSKKKETTTNTTTNQNIINEVPSSIANNTMSNIVTNNVAE